MQILNKHGNIIKLTKPHRNKLYKRKCYMIQCNIKSGTIQENIKAINGYIAIIKFCFKHPIVLFKIN